MHAVQVISTHLETPDHNPRMIFLLFYQSYPIMFTKDES